jgi:hypothetical protein
VQIRGFVIKIYDQMTDTKVTGIINWIVHLDLYPDGIYKRWDLGELIILNMGNWDMTFVGWDSLEDDVTYEIKKSGS